MRHERRFSWTARLLLIAVSSLSTTCESPGPSTSRPVSTSPAPQAQAANRAGVALEIRLDGREPTAAERVASGSPVVIRVTLSNLGDDAVSVVRSHALFMYGVQIVGPSGEPTPKTAYGKEFEAKVGMGPNSPQTLSPGVAFVDRVDLSKYWDMTRAGTYSICLSGGFQRSGRPITLTSNTLTIVIRDR